MILSERKRSISDYERDQQPEVRVVPKRNCSSQPVPDFDCSAYFQSEIQTIKLSQLLSTHRYLLLFFYECDFTQDATRDVEQVMQHYTQFQQQQVIPLMISTDTPLVHRGFCSPGVPGALSTPPSFPMLGDTTRLIARHFGVLDDSSGMARRCVFLLDNQGRIKYSFTPLDKAQPYCMPLLLSMAT
ncbi:thioredoxin-like protein [Gongronella butleri]|nr:thioredoxin-like protein [Gongronella butleri]